MPSPRYRIPGAGPRTLLAALLATLALIGGWSAPPAGQSGGYLLSSPAAGAAGTPDAAPAVAEPLPALSRTAPGAARAASGGDRRTDLAPGGPRHDGGSRGSDLAVLVALAATAALLRYLRQERLRLTPWSVGPGPTRPRAPPVAVA